MLVQQSKATWLRLGDSNTKYFHSVLKQKRLKQIITQLQDENMQVHTQSEQIAGIFVRYFSNLLREKGDGGRQKADEIFLKGGHTLTVQQQMSLLEPVTTKEVKEAVFSIKITKSAGPDGYSSGFFRDAWNIVGKDITCAVMNFMKNGKILGEINTTV